MNCTLKIVSNFWGAVQNVESFFLEPYMMDALIRFDFLFAFLWDLLDLVEPCFW
jgi:hypothetical protein